MKEVDKENQNKLANEMVCELKEVMKKYYNKQLLSSAIGYTMITIASDFMFFSSGGNDNNAILELIDLAVRKGQSHAEECKEELANGDK